MSSPEATNASARAALESLATALSAKSGDTEVRIVIDAIPVVVRYALRASGSSSTQWTEVAAHTKDVPGGTPVRFFLDIRPTALFDTAKVKANRLRDVTLGDSAFDEAFMVEAAPEDLVHSLFDAPMRAEMQALLPIRVFSSDGAIEIERQGWTTSVALLERLAKLAVRIAGSIHPAAERAIEGRRRTAPGGGYRDGPPAADAIRRGWDADLQALTVQRETRLRRERRFWLTFAIAVLALVLGAGIALAFCA